MKTTTINIPADGSTALRGAFRSIFFGLLVFLVYDLIRTLLETPGVRYFWDHLPIIPQRIFSLGFLLPLHLVGIGLVVTGAPSVAGRQNGCNGPTTKLLAVGVAVAFVVLLLARVVLATIALGDIESIPFWLYRFINLSLLSHFCLFLTTVLLISIDRNLHSLAGKPPSIAPYLMLWFTPVLLVEIAAYLGSFADIDLLLPEWFSWLSRIVYLFVAVALIVFTSIVAGKCSGEPAQIRVMNKAFYLTPMIAGWFLALTGLAGLLAIASMGRGGDARTIPFLLPLALVPAMLGVAIPLMILIYKSWAAISQGRPRTTPGLAIGLLFIPFFNLYWMFQVYWGWTKDFNRYAQDDGLDVKRAPEGLALTVCIFVLLSFIPLLGLLFALINQILLMVYVSMAINSVNSLATALGKQTSRGSRQDFRIA